MVTREQARKIAEAYLISHPMPDYVGILDVDDGTSYDKRIPRVPGELKDYWIAGCRPRKILGFVSGPLILVSKYDGSVIEATDLEG